MPLTDVKMDRDRNTVKDNLPFFKGMLNSFKTCTGQTWDSTAQTLTSEIPSILVKILICRKDAQFPQFSTQLSYFMAAMEPYFVTLHIF